MYYILIILYHSSVILNEFKLFILLERQIYTTNMDTLTYKSFFLFLCNLNFHKIQIFITAGQYTPCDGKSPSAVVADLDNLPPDKVNAKLWDM